MKKRNLAAVLLLPIVTLGIYCIYWLYATRKELIRRNGDAHSIPPVIVLFIPIFIFIGLAMLVFVLGLGGSSATIVNITAILLGMLGVLSILAVPLWWTWKYCRVVAATTHDMDFTQLYVLYVAIGWLFNLLPIWMFIVQLSFNKLANAEATASPPPAHNPEYPAQT